MKLDIDKFLKIEKETNAFEIKVNNINVWERIRFKVQRIILEKNGVGQAHTATRRNIKNYLKGPFSFLKNTLEKNPFFVDSHDILFLGHPRRKQNSQGLWEDIYCDPIHNFCNFDYVHMEKAQLLDHKRPPLTANLKYLDMVNFFSNLPIPSKVFKLRINKKASLNIKKLEAAIDNNYDTKINITSLIREALKERFLTYWIYKVILKRVKPKLAVLVVGYTEDTFIEVCKSLSIPVIELQHGIIGKSHLGYNFPDDVKSHTFPDYLLTFGDYWNEQVNLPLPEERVIPVGYPYMDLQKKKYSDIKEEKSILFISQGTIGKELSKLAKSISELNDLSYKIIYKLHPGEYDRWKEIYPWLLDSNIQIVDSDTPQLYELFARSKMQVGVTSTALYEGLSFDLDTYIYVHDSWSIDSPLLTAGLAKQVVGPKDLANKILNRPYFKDNNIENEIFNPNSLETIRTALNHLLKCGATF
jgi:hypothetical protein